MIHIAIIDQNKIYRESLKMVLEQIDGFRVVLDSSDSNWVNSANNISVQLMIIDGSIGKEKCNELVNYVLTNGISRKTLVLVMFSEDLDMYEGEVETMLKSAGKREFEERIREIVADNENDSIANPLTYNTYELH
ncbi:MAG: response regulator transcription factor [Bacteroidales bacterium]|nr:response regulator transcription factor [Bacteroidales bacterium]